MVVASMILWHFIIKCSLKMADGLKKSCSLIKPESTAT